MIKRVGIITVTLVVIIITNFPFRIAWCEYQGGRWAKIDGTCTPRNCAEFKICRPSYINNNICKSLVAGTPEAEVFFHLGMPLKVDGSDYVFQGGGGEPDIPAVIQDGKLISINCSG